MQSYRDFDLEITDPQRDGAGAETLLIRVAASPAGEQRRAEATRVTVGADVRKNCGRLDRRELDLQSMIALGRSLGDILLPAAARGYFERSRAALQDGEGLRLRLKLDTWGVADLPWEFAWLPPAGTVAAVAGAEAPVGAAAPADATGFLAIDPRISIVRYELLSEPIGRLEPTGVSGLRVVAVLAAPKDERWVPLDLEGEERGLREALDPRDEIELEIVEDATLANLEKALLEGAQVFHFAGHGRFMTPADDKVEMVAGKGFLIFRDADGRGAEVPAETVVVNLRGRGVRLAVLGACEGARRDRINPWTGIAPALIRGGLPAAVAMQATLYDRSAVAFSTRFYEALALGLPIDAAVSAGRLAIWNEGGPGERDWGVPVVYLRAETGVLFPVQSRKGGADAAEEPLGRRGWINLALAAALAGFLTACFYLFAQPRVSEQALLGGGLSVGGIGAVVLLLVQSIAGDDARRWARRALRRPFASIAIGAVLAAAVVLSLYLATHRPTVLRLVPGTMLANEFRDDRTYALRVRQGEDPRAETDWDWEVELGDAAGVVVGASPRITALATGRAAVSEGERFGEYLVERRVPEALRDFWRIAWSKDPHVLEDPRSTRRRGGSPITIDLICNGRPVALEKSSFTADELGVGSEAAGFEVLFIEPSEDCPDLPMPP